MGSERSTELGASASRPGSRASTEPLSGVSAASGFDPSRGVLHLRNGRAQRHPQTYGDGKTWCGKKLLGQPETGEDGVETFISYGNKIHTTYAPDAGTCERCREAFEGAYAAAFPEGLKPVATFRLDSPSDVARAKAVLSPEALNSFFGPGGSGMAAFDAALRDSDGCGEAGETAKQGSTRRATARAEGIARKEVS